MSETGRRILNGSPLAFGEGNVRVRIKNVLNYKKPRFWVIFIGVIIIIATSVGLLSSKATDINLKTDDIAKFVENNLWEFISKSDVNWDGREESIYLDKSQIEERLVTLRIIDVSDVELWSEQISTSHAGWNQLFLCEMDDKQYLLRYNPVMYQGYSTYVYSLFTLEDHKEKVFRTNKLEFDINGTIELDVTKMIDFADEVNVLLAKSTLLISSNGGDFSFGPNSAELFFERFSWLDEYEKLFVEGDSLESKLQKFSGYSVSNRRLME